MDDALQEDAWQKKSQLSLAETEQTDEVTYTPEEADERQHITLQKGPGGFGMRPPRGAGLRASRLCPIRPGASG